VAELLYLVHRMPFPPDKGDKVRSCHLLRHLAARHRVHLGTFIDDPADEAHLPAVRELCASVYAVRLHPRRARIASLAGLATGEALTLHYYRNAGLMAWVQRLRRERPLDAAVVFCSAMAPYAEAAGVPAWVDFVDVDSAKWTAYADQHLWPMSWLYRREGRRLLAYERQAASQARRGFFATEKETELFRQLAPECAGRVEAMSNGVDADFFSPSPQRASPFEPGETPLVFTGAMDYWPNVDAVSWFAQTVLPRLRQARPELRLHIVGRSPTPAVRALAADAAGGVVVTGTVPDVRPWLQHAAVVVAPLRVARGIQNKILEAMAMGRPVVAASDCVEALVAEPGREILAAAGAADYQRCIELLLGAPDRAQAIGTAGRQRVLQSYTWDAHLAVLDRHLAALHETAPDIAAAAHRVRVLAA
jgi:polysaccharide biosynthesis protein PslH